MNVNNGNISGATGYSPAPQAPENTPEGTCFGRSVIVIDKHDNFDNSASILEGGKIKATFHTDDMITSAEITADGTRAMINTRDGVSRVCSKTDGFWYIQDSITQADLRDNGTRAVVTDDGVARTYTKDAEGIWLFHHSSRVGDW
ncbi:hypothetical protein [Endozoicomonas sp. 2B-B]